MLIDYLPPISISLQSNGGAARGPRDRRPAAQQPGDGRRGSGVRLDRAGPRVPASRLRPRRRHLHSAATFTFSRFGRTSYKTNLLLINNQRGSFFNVSHLFLPSGFPQKF